MTAPVGIYNNDLFGDWEGSTDSDEIDFNSSDYQIFICSLCNKKSENPYFLTCLHSYCKSCIDIRLSAEDNYRFKCLLCPTSNQTQFVLSRNPLPQLLQTICDFKQTSPYHRPKCQDCLTGRDTVSVAYCIECNIFMCQLDLAGHMKFGSNHIWINFLELNECNLQELLAKLTKRNNNNIISDINDNNKCDNGVFKPRSPFRIEDCIEEAIEKSYETKFLMENLNQYWEEENLRIIENIEEMKKNLEERKAQLLLKTAECYKQLLLPLKNFSKELVSIINYSKYILKLSKFTYVQGIPNDILTNQVQSAIEMSKKATVPHQNYKVDVYYNSKDLAMQEDMLEMTIKRSPCQPATRSKRIFKNVDYTECELATSCITYAGTKELQTPLDISADGKHIYLLFASCYKNYLIYADKDRTECKNFVEFKCTRLYRQLDPREPGTICVLNDKITIFSGETLQIYATKDNTFIRAFDMNLELVIPKLYNSLHDDCIIIAGLGQNFITHVNLYNRRSNSRQLSNPTDVFIDLALVPSKNKVLILTQYSAIDNNNNNEISYGYSLDIYNDVTLTHDRNYCFPLGEGYSFKQCLLTLSPYEVCIYDFKFGEISAIDWTSLKWLEQFKKDQLAFQIDNKKPSSMRIIYFDNSTVFVFCNGTVRCFNVK